jgi:hypothetical protein
MMKLITNTDKQLISPQIYLPLAIVEQISDENKELQQ